MSRFSSTAHAEVQEAGDMSVKPIPEGLAAASPDDEGLKLGELIVDRTKPACHFLPKAIEFLVDGVELLVNRVETRSRFGLESGEFLTEGVDGLAIGIGLDLDACMRPVRPSTRSARPSTRPPRAPTAANTAR
jgi:hypothetical protein